MQAFGLKRCFSFLLAVIMIFSMVPATAFAAENDDHGNGIESIVSEPKTEATDDESTEVIAAPSELAVELKDRINAVLLLYGISADMTEDQIGRAITAKGWSVNKPVIAEINQIEAMADAATEEDGYYVMAYADVETFARFLSVWKPMFAVAMAAASGTHTPVTGVTVSVSGATDNSMSSGAVTVTAKGSGGIFGFGASAKTATVNIYNDSGSKAELSFSWTATSVNELKIDGTKYTGSSGSFEKVMDAGEKITVTITTAKNGTTNKLVMKSFSIAAVKSASNVTFQYDSSMGSVTVAGNAVAAGGQVEVPSAGAALVATPASGATFLGWINGDSHVLLSTAASYTLEPASDMSVQAVFTKGNAWFLVNGNSLYGDLNEAVAAASQASNKTIAVFNNGTLPAGTYTIPSGITLLVPSDAANSVYTEKPVDYTSTSPVNPTIFRTLTMAEGANLVVNGSLNVSGGMLVSTPWPGSVYGSLGKIQMASGSNITVNNGAKLYAWGFISGAGSVTAKNGATVYEDFQVVDFMGGDNTTKIVGNDYGVFPFTHYYIQNIEVPMTLEAGAKEYGYMAVTITLVGVQGSSVPFIGPDGMFNVKSGYLVKDYDEATGRLVIDVHGAMDMKSLSISMKMGMLGSTTINSKDYQLPVTSNLTVRVCNGGSIVVTQNLSMLPGSQLYVEEGADVTLGNGNFIVFYDEEDWITIGLQHQKYIPVLYTEGGTNYAIANYQGAKGDAFAYVEGTLDASAGSVYTTSHGAAITAAEGAKIILKSGTKANTYQVQASGSDNKTLTYVPIALTPAKLMNADGTYCETANVPYGEFLYSNGVWTGTCYHVLKETVTAATCTVDGVKVTSCACGYSVSETIPAVGHTAEAVNAVAPDCTNTGLTAGEKCSVCGEILVAQEVVPAKGHIAGAAPTCSDAQTCTVCGAELAAALGHTAGAEATCTDPQVCTVCGETLVKALGHTNETIPAVAPDCENEGLTEGVKCSVCGEILTAQEPVDALGHTNETIPAVAPDCENTGLTEGVKCSTCGKTLVAQETVDALGHTNETIPAVAPDCENTGLTEGVKCSTCGKTLVAQETVDALGHTAGAEATCNDDQTCTVCGKVLVAALGHDMVRDNEIPATCTEPGHQAGAHCSRCSYTEGGGEIPAKGHTNETIPAVAPDCENEGLTEGVKCSVCGEILTAQETVDALGHDEVIDKAVAPTCTVTGRTEGKHCSVCGKVLVVQNVVDPLGHTNETIPAVAPDCENSGLTEGVKCSVCGEILTAQEPVDALGHTDEKIPAVAPDCENSGLTEGVKCSTCGKTLVAQETVDALGHTDEKIPAVAPDCENSGLTEGVKCAVCGEILTAQEPVDALGHTDEKIPAVAPDCENEGLTEGVKCAVCGEILTAQDSIASLGHTVVETEEEPALCGVAGITAGSYCSVCGKTLSGREVIPARDHQITQFDAKRPTYGNVGWEAYERCLRCGYTTYVEIPALEIPTISDYETFIETLGLLEEIADLYVKENPNKDPLNLMIKYIRTGVDRYNSGSWGIMAGYEDSDFAKYVSKMEDTINSMVDSEEDMIAVCSLKKLEYFTLPNGNLTDFGHMFGTMDITYHNKFGINHADVAGWAGDLVDLLEFSDTMGVSGTLEEMVAEIGSDILLETPPIGTTIPGFNQMDMYGDMDALYIMTTLQKQGYEKGDLVALMSGYFTEELSDEDRAAYFMKTRLDGVSTRSLVREAVYNAYTSNKVIATLEGTREFTTSDLDTLRKAACYAFADYICKLAGDYVENTTGVSYFEVFSSSYDVLAPGITQEIKMATTTDDKQIVYYIATADITRSDVDVFANYNDADPAKGWEMQRVLDQANAAQNKYGNPESEYYIPNYNVIVSTNGAGFNMGTGEPGGLLVMGGVEYHPIDKAGFFGILKDGTPVIGTTEEYNTIYKDQVRDGIAGFGANLIQDGKIVAPSGSTRASRTAVGITKTGKVVLMVLDGRQPPFSSGGDYAEIAQIMLEAGCWNAINLDGGGSSTFVAKQPGEEELSVVNRPSDGFQRSVAASLLMVSTAPSSTAFDHAVLESETDYMTVGAAIQLTAKGISATGNEAELPEGTTWAVSDDRWATVSEDGLVTALRNGDVEIYLMSGETVIGAKTLHIVQPDKVYFTKTNIDTVYGATVTLPVKALYEGKPVTLNTSDLVFTLSNAQAGVVDGFKLICTSNEASGIKNVGVTVALASDPSITGFATVSLYKQGEMSFDFDQATGGDRMLAWYREVLNATLDEGSTYMVVNPDEQMITNYTLAIDMTQIPIPEKLEDLTYMLPGSDVEGASAWTFLMQLAQRISDMSEITATVQFDPDLEVDLSNMKLVNEFFVLTATEIDEESNTATLVLNWKKQTAAIDPNTANPLCIVSGIKLTPKADADWGNKNRLDLVNIGSISYKIYMRATALYSFSQKPDNQKTFGLYDYVNPNDAEDRGGYFQDTYATFEDNYVLINSVKEGWVVEEGGYAYYADGNRLTGIAQVEGMYYDFGETGINAGKTPYTGLFQVDGKTYYALKGALKFGWVAIGTDYYYFSTTDFTAYTGVCKVDGLEYTFNDSGKLVEGAFDETAEGIRYFWAGQQMMRHWADTLDGRRLYINPDGYVVFGHYPVLQNSTEATTWMYFDEETGNLIGNSNGFVFYEGILYYCVDGSWVNGVLDTGNGLVFCGYNGIVNVNGECYVGGSLTTTAGLEFGYYWSDENGYIMKEGFATLKGDTYYFSDYVRAKGFTKVGEDYYFFNAGSGKMNADVTLWVSGNNPYGIASGYYYFQADGKMYIPDPNGEKKVELIDGKLYFTIDGVKQTNGLNELDGEYYYAGGDGVLVVDETIWVAAFNDLIAPGNGYFAFDAEGKMVKTGFVTGGGDTYYYDNLVRAKGFTKVGEDYYFFNAGSGKLSRDVSLWVSGNNPYGIASGTYYFQPDGKMYIPNPNGEKKVELIDGKLYFTIDGVKQTNGLNELDGEYYYANPNGVLEVSNTIWVAAFNDLIAPGNGYFAFDAEGKLVKTGFVTGGGDTYYYDNLVRAKGFTKVGEDYYFFNAGSGKLCRDESLWVSGNNPYGIASGYYYFQADGKMYIPNPNGEKKIVEKDGKLYFTIDGVNQTNGLNELDGEYYYANPNGVLEVSNTIWVAAFNDLIAPGNGYFAFDAEGKMVKTGFVTGGGDTYYYDNLVRAKGFTKVGEKFYFFNAGSGKLSCDATLWVSGNNPYGIASGYYYFQADGSMYVPDPNGQKKVELIDGKLYFTIDGMRQTNGLNELDGEYYYANANGTLVTDSTIWISSFNDLMAPGNGYFAFDAEGKMVQTGFVTGGGDTYYYDNLVRAKGFTKVGDDYYFFNAGSGKMSINAALWVSGNNPYGIASGTYQFGSDGKMILN